MLSIHGLIPKECIIFDTEIQNREDIILKLTNTLNNAGKIIDTQKVYKDILERESLSGTGIGFGCAVPHAHSEGVENTIIAAAHLKNGVDFNAADGISATLVFLMVGPKRQAGLHLKLLSKMARFFHDKSFIKELNLAKNSEEFWNIIKQKEER